MTKNLLLYVIFCLLLSGAGYAQSSTSENNTSPHVRSFARESLSDVNTIELYPNPVSEHLNVSIRNSTFENITFELYNIIGNNLEVQVEKTGDNTYKINLKELNSGYYLLIIKDPVKRLNKSFKFQKI